MLLPINSLKCDRYVSQKVDCHAWLFVRIFRPSCVSDGAKRNVFDASKEERMAHRARQGRMLVDGGMHACTAGLFALYSSNSNVNITNRAK